MSPEFWHTRWQRNEIGFHEEKIHVYLQEFWPHLQLPQGQPVLIPLCGKSNDMLWLLEQGYPILGVELSPIAVAAFFQNNQLSPRQFQRGNFTCWEQEDVQILCGDFFALTPSDTNAVRGVYDRASLIALPEEMRKHYATHLVSLLPQGTKMLLITLEYPSHEMAGPPFSVAEAEVNRLYQDHFTIQHFATKEVLSETPSLKARGITKLTESAYLLEKR